MPATEHMPPFCEFVSVSVVPKHKNSLKCDQLHTGGYASDLQAMLGIFKGGWPKGIWYLNRILKQISKWYKDVTNDT